MSSIPAYPEFEPNRGVYDTHRAAALSGVPSRTLHYWAQHGIYLPSVSPEPRVRLWSWADLLVLRAIDWLRKDKGEDHPKAATIPGIRAAFEQMTERGASRQQFSDLAAVSQGGRLFLQFTSHTEAAAAGHQGAMADILHLVQPYGAAPHLLEPRPLLRIIPGKLHGEPHIFGTRISSAAIFSLHQSGYTMAQISTMYPEVDVLAIAEAIEFEGSLSRPQAA